MARYIRVDDNSDYEWMLTVIASLKRRDPNDRFLQINYGHIIAWEKYLEESVGTKSPSVPPKLIVEEDKTELIPPPPKKRGRPTSSKNKVKREKPAVVINDIFMCPAHPNRSGKRAPTDECEKCWEIYAQLQGPARADLAKRRLLAKGLKKSYGPA